MRQRTSYEAGFSLVEIMVVLFIIGIMSSVVVLSIQPPKSALEKQATLLTSQINALAQDGLISGSVNAVGFSRDGYTLYSFENSEWTERVTDEWEENYRMTLKRVSAKLEMPKTTEPIIMFQPTGLSTPFEFTLSDRDTKYALKTSGDGKVELVKSQP